MKSVHRSRRQFVKLSAAGAGVLALAACGALPPAPPVRTSPARAPSTQMKFTPALLSQMDALVEKCLALPELHAIGKETIAETGQV